MENVLIITILIFLVIYMYIGPNRLLKVSAHNVNFDKDRRFCIGFTSLDLDGNIKLKKLLL